MKEYFTTSSELLKQTEPQIGGDYTHPLNTISRQVYTSTHGHRNHYNAYKKYKRKYKQLLD